MYKKKCPSSSKKENVNPKKSKTSHTPVFDYIPKSTQDNNDIIIPPKSPTPPPPAALSNGNANVIQQTQNSPEKRSIDDVYNTLITMQDTMERAIDDLKRSVEQGQEAVAALRVEMRANHRKSVGTLVDDALIIFPLAPGTMDKLERADETSKLRLAYVSKQ